MKEQTPYPRDYWQIDEIEHALASEAHPRLHAVHGEGYTLPLGDPEAPTAHLDIYPETGLMRYRAEGLSLAITKAVPFTITKGGILFNASTPTEERTLFIGDRGEITLFAAQREAPPIPQPPIEEKPQHQSITGRLVQDPIEGRTKHNAPMTRLSLRENDAKASIEVFAFGPLAEDAGLYFHKDGDYTFSGELRKLPRGDENGREIFVLDGMRIGRDASAPRQR